MHRGARRRAASPELRIGLPPELGSQPGGSGHTNMWRHVIGRLERMVLIERATPHPRVRGIDVWLGDGHQGPLPVEEAQLLQVHEAGWGTPELRATVGQDFLDHLDTHIAMAAKAGAHIITPSLSAASQVQERFGVPDERVHAAHHGVDSTLFRPGLGGGGALVARAGGRGDVPYVLYVGLAHPRKNVEALRRAMVGVARRGLEHQLVLVGSPPHDRPDGATHVAALGAELPGFPGRVVLVPTLTDAQLAALMAGAAVLCHPSLMEGFGLPALEAMACGTPVVVSNRGALPEVVGDAGVVVEPDADDLEHGLLRVLDDPGFASALSEAGRDRALAFTWERTATGWLAALEKAGHEFSVGRRRAA